MAQRTWFTEQNTRGLDKGDLSVINRAARRLEDIGYNINHLMLMRIRKSYKPGMCANDIIERIEDEAQELVR